MKWPENFYDIGGKSFEWVFENKKEFVLFTLTNMHNPLGLFRDWQHFCMNKVKQILC